jgi:hypothetical protein
MRKIAIGVIASLGMISSHIALANNALCISLTNAGKAPVEFSTMSDSGYIYTIKPGETAILSSAEMAAECDRKGKYCTVWARGLDRNEDQRYILSLPRGASITYMGPRNYPAKNDANIRCVR